MKKSFLKELQKENSPALENLFSRYTHLPLGGKEIVCPYWMNNLKKGIFGPFGGKGTPEQIVEATKNEAKAADLSLREMTAEEILNFMKERKIGVDCSGFVFWMLDSLEREKGGRGLEQDFYPNQTLAPTKANVATLTEPQFVLSIKLNDVKVGDIIRLDKGRHVAIVIEVIREVKTKQVKEIVYAHSSARTKMSGVHAARILIIDSQKELEAQKWCEESKRGGSYGSYLFPQEGDGLKRLKILA